MTKNSSSGSSLAQPKIITAAKTLQELSVSVSLGFFWAWHLYSCTSFTGQRCPGAPVLENKLWYSLWSGASCPSYILHLHRLWPFWGAGGSDYQFGPDWNLSNNYWKDCKMNFVQTLMIPWGWTWLTLVITRHFLQQKHRVLICVICDAVSFVIFIDLLDAFGFICSERCSCTEPPDLIAEQSKMAGYILYLIGSFFFLPLCWWFHNESSALTRAEQVSGEDITVSALSSTLPFPATPSHWRLEFIVMVTAVCIIHAGGGC